MADLVECINEDFSDGMPLGWFWKQIIGPMPKLGQRYRVISVFPCECGSTGHFFYKLEGMNPQFAFWFANFRPVEEHKRSTDTGFSILLDAAKEVMLPAKPVKVPEPV